MHSPFLRRMRRRFRHLNWPLIGIAAAAGGVFLVGLFVLWTATLKLPDLDSFEARKQIQSTRLYDRTGEVLLYDVHQDIRRTTIPLEEMSPYIKQATIAIEDQDFYEHRGIEPTSIIRAILVDIATLDFSQGGSTITQQVVKNALLTPEKTISRKLKEWVLALKLERLMDKDQILAMYLNEIPYGGVLYGIEEASQSFFGKRAKDLTIPEAAYLAALPQAPSFYSPHGSHRDRLEARKNLVLERMRANDMITEEEHQAAKTAAVEFKTPAHRGIKAPHFVFHVLSELEDRYGEKAVEEDGFKVTTTLDWKLQEKAEAIVEERAKQNEKDFNAENAGIIALDPKNGDILAMVGSRGYFDEEIEGNYNVTTAPRQPGSTFKPFAYAEAFRKGYTPATVLFNLRTQFSTACRPEQTTETGGDCYSPVNYDGQYNGPMTMREALAQSVNVPSVKTLYLAGIENSLKLAERMGITTLGDWRRYGLTLVLGGGEVTLLDMSGAYGVFANEGKNVPERAILSIEDRDGAMVEKSDQPEGEEVLERDVALMISDVLSDNAARAPAFGESSLLNIPGRDVAVKTGTTNNYVDAWIIGYTPSVVVGAWAGNNNSDPMAKRVAGFIVAPLWNEVMREALALVPVEQFPAPPPVPQDIKPVLRGVWQGGQVYRVDKTTGKLATEFTPPELVEERSVGEVHSILYWVNRSDPRGPAPSNSAADSQFAYWEYPVRAYVQGRGIPEGGSVPTETDDVHGPQFAPVLSLRGIDPSRAYARSDTLTVSVDSSGRFPLKAIEVFVNGVSEGLLSNPPFVFTLPLADAANLAATNELKVVGTDEVGNKGEVRISFNARL